MATQIKPTPVLEGEEAEDFLREVGENEGRAVPRSDVERARSTYERLTEPQELGLFCGSVMVPLRYCLPQAEEDLDVETYMPRHPEYFNPFARYNIKWRFMCLVLDAKERICSSFGRHFNRPA